MDFTGAQGAFVTHLLHDRQIHAELRQTYYHVALRLDSMQAVQDESPWRLDFNPHTQQITLHSIRTWRNGAPRSQADLSAARILDRRAAGAKPPEPLTLSLMLEDIRLGDILEWSYTVESKPLLLPGQCAALFALPAAAPVGKFYFSLIFDPARHMQWRSSAAEWEPVKNENHGSVHWVWTRDNYPGLLAEYNMPEWYVAWPWIQVSDCPDWGAIASAFAEAWPEELEDPVMRQMATALAAGNGGRLQQAERAVQMVRDECRSTNVDGELDGRPPAPPGLVARRRYGDGKDLSFLLVHLLKAMGIEARLVFVNTVYRQSIVALLPAPDLFNHVLVEYQAGGETRWVDAARPNRAIGNYGAGLLLAGPGSGLASAPAGSITGGAYELMESILIDTAGGWSWLAVVVTARGHQAEALRQELENEGVEALSNKRLREYARRFTNVRRDGQLEYRDDRANNVFRLAEVYEIKDFLSTEPRSKWSKLEMHNDFIVDFLRMPDTGPRRAPFALPHPCQMTHIIELHSIALAPAPIQQRSVQTHYLDFSRVRKTMAGSWTMKLSLSTLAGAVPPESVDEHRRAIQKIRGQSSWSMLLPAGDARPHRRSDFGVLPPVAPVAVPVVPAALLAPENTPTPAPPPPPTVETVLAPLALQPPVEASPSLPAPPEAQPILPTSSIPPPAPPTPPPPSTAPGSPPVRSKRRKRHRRKDEKGPKPKWPIYVGSFLGLTLIVIVIFVAKNADHWKIFRKRPPPPTTELTPMPDR